VRYAGQEDAMRYWAMIGLLALAACAPTEAERRRSDDAAARSQSKLERELRGLVAAGSANCLPSIRQRQARAYGATIVYEVSKNLKYRSDTTGGCEGMERGDILITQSPTGNLCRGDIATTVDPASRFQTGSCSFGDFVPYRRP
jgi:hypothetical protein